MTKPRKVTRTTEVEVEGEGEETTPGRPAVAPGGYAAPADGIRLAPIFADLAESDALRTLRVTRTFPKDPPYGGFIRDFPPDLTIESIRQLAGGGTYEIVAFDSAGRKRLTEIVRVGGRPKVPPAEGEEDRTAPTNTGGSIAELRAFMIEVAQGQRQATADLITSMRESGAARERESAAAAAASKQQFQEFFLMIKEENKTTIQTVVTAVTESGKASMAAVAEASKSTVAAAMSLANGAMELAKSGGGKESGGSDLEQMLNLAKQINTSPWEKFLPILMITMMGGKEGGGGGSIPPEALAALMGQEMKAIPDKGGSVADQSRPTPERVGNAADREEDLAEHQAEEDPVGDFLQWIASTPDEVLAPAIAARLRAGSVPDTVAAAIQAGIAGDNSAIVVILTEYSSMDLVPRLQRVAEQFKAAAEAARAAK